MNRLFCLIRVVSIVTLTCCFALNAQALPSPAKQMSSHGGGDFGMGISLGDPMGVSAKLFMHPNHALQWHFAWLPLHHGAGGVSMDYLFHPATIASAPRILDLIPYLGVGFGFSLWGHGNNKNYDGVSLGIMLRTLVGMAIHWKKIPLDTVFEGGWTPYIVETNPSGFSAGHGDISVKVRYYF